jgi:hypothetical protein
MLSIDDLSMVISQFAFWLQVTPEDARLHWAATAAEIEHPRNETEAVEWFIEFAQKLHAAMIQLYELAGKQVESSKQTIACRATGAKLSPSAGSQLAALPRLSRAAPLSLEVLRHVLDVDRRRLYAARKAGFVATVSARALMVEEAILLSLAQLGISPQRRRASFRLPSTSRTAATSCVGAML